MANNWRGCKDIKMIWHGEWADPELVTEYDGVEYWFNYYDIENALWEDFLESEGIEEKDTYDERGMGISDEYEDKFSKYCQDNAYTYLTYDLIPSLDPDNYTKDGEKWFWVESDVADYNADLDSDEDDFDYDDIEESCGKKAKKKNKSKIVESAGSSNVKINDNDYNTLYTDIEGVFGEPGVTVSLGEMKEYWNEEKDNDPVLSDYSSYDEWFEDTIQLLEPLQESLGKGKKMLKEGIDTYDLNSAVYNALTDVCFEFMNRGNHPTEEEMNIAIEWWQTHFWDSDDAPED